MFVRLFVRSFVRSFVRFVRLRCFALLCVALRCFALLRFALHGSFVGWLLVARSFLLLHGRDRPLSACFLLLAACCVACLSAVLIPLPTATVVSGLNLLVRVCGVRCAAFTQAGGQSSFWVCTANNVELA